MFGIRCEMTEYILDANEHRKKNVKLIDKDKSDILDYLKTHEDDETAFDFLMEKYNTTRMAIFSIVVEDEMRKMDGRN